MNGDRRSLARDGVTQKIYPETLERVQDRARKLRAADPLHREVTFDQALVWMLDKLDQIDKERENREP
jgi:hypothetical protein